MVDFHDASHGIIGGGELAAPTECADLPDLQNYCAVAFANPSAGWLVGTQGRIVKLSF